MNRFRFSLISAACVLVCARAFAFQTNGDLDITFDAGKITNGQVQAAVVQPDKMVVIAGCQHWQKIQFTQLARKDRVV